MKYLNNFRTPLVVNRINEVTLTESEQIEMDNLKAERASFVLEILTSTLSDTFEDLVTLVKEESKDKKKTEVKESPKSVKDTETLEPVDPIASTSSSSSCDDRVKLKEEHEVKQKIPEAKGTPSSPEVKTVDDEEEAAPSAQEFELPVTSLLWMSPSTTESTNTALTAVNGVMTSARSVSASGVTAAKGSSMASAPETPPKVRSKSHAKACEKV